MAKRSEIVIRRKPRMSGLSAAAARLGVSRTHLREVINGNRQSKHLMARLAKAGVKVEVAGWRIKWTLSMNASSSNARQVARP